GFASAAFGGSAAFGVSAAFGAATGFGASADLGASTGFTSCACIGRSAGRCSTAFSCTGAAAVDGDDAVAPVASPRSAFDGGATSAGSGTGTPITLAEESDDASLW